MPEQLYDILYARYGDLQWWPAKSPYEVMVGAILTQNTSWNNVEKALERFPEEIKPLFVAETDTEALIEIVRPAGFYNQKAVYLKTLTAWYERYDYSVSAVQAEPVQKIRSELLALRGIGKETADSILLYAFDFPAFVIDAYTLRLLKRLTASERLLSYDEAQAIFTAALDACKYNNMHAMIVVHAKEHCKSKPVCAGCPIGHICQGMLP
jgi:endonuclease-3 related protein